MADIKNDDVCPLCGRPLGDPRLVEKHHWIPKLKGGKETGNIHRICHRKIHSLFSEGELARDYPSPAALQQHPDIKAFIHWLKNKPPEFTAPTRDANHRRGKKRR